MIYMPIALALLGLVYMIVKQKWVMKQDAGDGKMKEISDHIYEGALAFLNAEYRLLAIFVVIVSILLAIVSFVVPTTHWLIVVAFIFGAIFSAFAGNIGMKIATKTNVRTTQAARTSLPNALKISFGGGKHLKALEVIKFGDKIARYYWHLERLFSPLNKASPPNRLPVGC